MRVRHGFFVAVSALLLGAGFVLAQQPPASPSPLAPPAPPAPTRLRTNSLAFPGGTPFPPESFAKPAATKPDALKFDAMQKTVNVKTGEAEAKFAFAVTNVSQEDAVIMSVHPSCGCTAAKLPSSPWVLKPGEGGEIGVTMNLAGKFGIVTKTVTVVTTSGSIPLLVKAVLPQEAYQNLQRVTERSRNMQIAAADRQAVFRGDCAKCHVEAGIGKKGHDLYAASCGICHDAEHRATMVPILRGRPAPYNREYWNNWVRNGKDGSLMPAFEAKRGGPLTDEQVDSLVDYLTTAFPTEPVPAHLVLPVPAVRPVAKPAAVPAASPQATVKP